MAENTLFDQLNTNIDSNETKVYNATAVNSFQSIGPNGEIIFDSTQQTLPGFIADTASLALTASTAPSYLPLVGGTITGNLTVNGTTTLNNVVTVTSSYSSGSTIFGDALIDTHRFTGSVLITGSSFTWNNSTLIASNITSSMSVASASQALTASFLNGSVTSASYAATASKISIVNLASDAGTYFPMFANNASGPVSLFADALTYTYQPSTNILTVTASLALRASGSLTGSLQGTATFADGATYANQIYIAENTSPGTYSIPVYPDGGFDGNNTLSSANISYDFSTQALTVNNITASNGLFGTASWATRALTASFVTNLNQAVTIGNITSTPSNENTLNIYPSPAGGAGEGGQILLAASGGIYTSASMLDTWQNYFRILRGTNTGGSNAQLLGLDLQTGNLSIAGALIPSAWTAGQVIKDIMLSNTEVTVSTTTIATSGTDTDFVTYSYTPVSSNSYLIIHYHLASYDFSGGTGNDSYISRIKVDGGEITYGTQSTVNGNRTGVLFPLTGRYTNSNTTAKSIVVACRRNSADDSITIVNSSTSMWLRITEIAR